MSSSSGALSRLLSGRNLRNDRFGTIAAILGVAVGAATVHVVAILDANTTVIEQHHAAATGPSREEAKEATKAKSTIELVPVRGGVRIEQAVEKKGAREDHEVLRDGIRAGSLLSFVLGALIVFFTFSAVMDRRRREVALLRSLGALPRQVAAIFLREAVLIGLAGGALGLLASIPTAVLAANFGITTTGHLKIDPKAMIFPWGTMLLISLLGAVTAVAGALRPIRQVTGLPISRALRPRWLEGEGADRGRTRSRTARSIALPIVALAYVLSRPFLQGALSPLSFHLLEAGAVCLGFVAALLLVPALVRRLGGVLVRLVPGGSSAERLLTRRRIEHLGHELSWSVSGVMVVFSLLLTLHIVTNSLKREVVTWAEEALNDELFVLPWYPKLRADTLTVSLPASVKVLTLTGRTPWPNALHATRATDLATFAEENGRPDLAAVARRLGPGKILLSRLMARRFQVREGDALDLSGPSGVRRLEIVGVSDGVGFTPMNASHRRARTFGLIDAADQDLIAPFADPIGTVAIVARASSPEVVAWRGADASKLTTRRGIHLMPALFYQNLRLSEANSDFLIFDLLLLLTSVLAGVGIGNQLLLSVRARQRELALYRVLGMTADQVKRLVLMEGAFIGVLGGCLASLLGVPLGYTAIGALRAISGFEVSFSLPIGYVIVTVLGSTVIATVASLHPAVKAARSSAAESVHHE